MAKPFEAKFLVINTSCKTDKREFFFQYYLISLKSTVKDLETLHLLDDILKEYSFINKKYTKYCMHKTSEKQALDEKK